MSHKERLHPIAVVLSFGKSLKEMLIPLIFFLFVNVGERAFFSLNSLAIVGVFLYIIISGIVQWMMFHYYIENEELRIEYGVFVKKRRYIPKDRIQSINISSGLLQRMFGLVRVQIETAGGFDKAEAELAAVTKEKAAVLQELLLVTPNNEGEALTAEKPKKIWKLSTKELFLASATSGGAGVIFSFIAAFLSQFDQFIPAKYVSLFIERALASSIAFIAFFIFIAALLTWLFSIAGTILKFGGFTLSKNEKELQIKSGILEQKQLTIPLHRIQAVRIVEGILRQPFGFAALYVESAGGGGKEENYSTVLYPLIRKKDVYSFLQEVLPEYAHEANLYNLPRRAMIRYMLRFSLPLFIIAVPVIIFVSHPYRWLALLPVIGGALLGYVQYKSAGWQLVSSHLYVSARKLAKTTAIVKKQRVQALESKQSYFQKRKKLLTVSVFIMSSFSGRAFHIVDLGEENADDLANWFSYQTKKLSL
ncbi:PH domain-containing protein [Bacillus taeanensis]|nr:PH domain-containing protein [Bacillus taeanensis]